MIKMSCLKPPKFVTFMKVDVAILLGSWLVSLFFVFRICCKGWVWAQVGLYGVTRSSSSAETWAKSRPEWALGRANKTRGAGPTTTRPCTWSGWWIWLYSRYISGWCCRSASAPCCHWWKQCCHEVSDSCHLFNLVTVPRQKLNNSHYSTSFVLLDFWLRCLGKVRNEANCQ